MGKKDRKSLINKNVASLKSEAVYINKNVATLIGNNENGDDFKVIISFMHLQNSYQCFSDWSKQEMNEFWSFYKKLHQCTWQQVYLTSGKTQKNGFAYTVIPISKYPNKEFKENLSKDITIFELRVNQKIRVHGFRNKAVFYICWLDKNHGITS